MPLESQIITEEVQQQGIASAAGFIIGTVIGTHDRFNTCLNQFPECIKVGFMQVLLACDGIELMTESLGTAMHYIMFSACACL